jgi:hypothetical protein|tara:strand:- start:348 stop:770 length:423 start_codon:yes stop_codon:yes gene_type:complete
MSNRFIGVLDLPLNPEIVSLATLSIPAGVCLESISIPSNGIAYITELEFTFLLDGEELWQGRGSAKGVEVTIPDELGFSEHSRSMLVLVSPSMLVSSVLSTELDVTEVPIAIRGHEGQCVVMVKTDDLIDFGEDFHLEWV